MSNDGVFIYGQYRKEWYSWVRLYHRDQYDNYSWLELSPHEVEIVLPITDEAFSANIKWVSNGQLSNNITPDTLYCGETLEIWADTMPDTIGTHMHLLFGGRVYEFGENYTGMFKEKPEKFIVAYGYGRDLMSDYRIDKLHAGLVLDLFNEVATELLDKGLIDGTNFVYQHNSWVSGVKEAQNYWDLLKSVASDGDWDFYVDNKRTLQAFSRGVTTLETVLTPDFDATWKWDIDDIINTIQVWGCSTGNVGSDSIYTETPTDWGGYTIQPIETSTICTKGTYAVWAMSNETITWAERTFSPAIDLSRGGRLHLYTRYDSSWKYTNTYFGWSEFPHDLMIPFKIGFTMYTDENNYYSSTVSITGGRFYMDRGFLYNWGELFIGFNQHDPKGWSWYGKPKWSEISSLRLEPIGPFYVNMVDGAFTPPPESTLTNFRIDDFYFTDMQIIGHYENESSIARYGIRTNPPMKNESIPNESVANAIAYRLVQAYGTPRISATDVDVDPDSLWQLCPGAWSLPVGWRCTLAIYDKSIPAELRQLTYNFNGKQITCKADIANCYVPKIERLFKIMTNLMAELEWNVSEFDNVCLHQAINDVNCDALEWSRVSEQFGLDAEMAYEKLYLFQSNDSWVHSTAWTGSIMPNLALGSINVVSARAYGYTYPNGNNWKIQRTCSFKTKGAFMTDFATPSDIRAYTSDDNGMGGFGIGNLEHWIFEGVYHRISAGTLIGFQYVPVPSDTELYVQAIYRNEYQAIAETFQIATIGWNEFHTYEFHMTFDDVNLENNILFVVDSDKINNTYLQKYEMSGMTTIGPYDLYTKDFVHYINASPLSAGGFVKLEFHGGILASPWE